MLNTISSLKLASLLRSKRERESAIQFSSDDNHRASISMSNDVAASRMSLSGLIASPLIEVLLIASTIAWLSHMNVTLEPLAFSPQ
jgi:exoribonuclease R